MFSLFVRTMVSTTVTKNMWLIYLNCLVRKRYVKVVRDIS